MSENHFVRCFEFASVMTVRKTPPVLECQKVETGNSEKKKPQNQNKTRQKTKTKTKKLCSGKI